MNEWGTFVEKVPCHGIHHKFPETSPIKLYVIFEWSLSDKVLTKHMNGRVNAQEVEKKFFNVRIIPKIYDTMQSTR